MQKMKILGTKRNPNMFLNLSEILGMKFKSILVCEEKLEGENRSCWVGKYKRMIRNKKTCSKGKIRKL